MRGRIVGLVILIAGLGIVVRDLQSGKPGGGGLTFASVLGGALILGGLYGVAVGGLRKSEDTEKPDPPST